MNSTEMAGIGMTSQRTRERLISRLIEQGITNQKVLDVIRMTPRHIFLDEALSHRAYEDTALPIGFAQTLSQPYIVARMTEILLSQGPLKKVLEIGTGSGYQGAVLDQLAPNGILVIPVGSGDDQDLSVVRRVGSSCEFDQTIVEKVKFVPLLGGLSR